MQKFQTAGANTVIIVEGLATEYRLSGRTTYRPVLMFTSVLDVNSATASSWVIGNVPYVLFIFDPSTSEFVQQGYAPA